MKVQLSPQMKGEALIRTEPNLREGNVCIHRDGQPGSLLSDWRQKERERTGKEGTGEGDGMIPARCWPRCVADLNALPSCWGPEITQINVSPISSISFDLRSTSRGPLTKQAFNVLPGYTLYPPSPAFSTLHQIHNAKQITALPNCIVQEHVCFMTRTYSGHSTNQEAQRKRERISLLLKPPSNSFHTALFSAACTRPLTTSHFLHLWGCTKQFSSPTPGENHTSVIKFSLSYPLHIQ